MARKVISNKLMIFGSDRKKPSEIPLLGRKKVVVVTEKNQGLCHRGVGRWKEALFCLAMIKTMLLPIKC